MGRERHSWFRRAARAVTPPRLQRWLSRRYQNRRSLERSRSPDNLFWGRDLRPETGLRSGNFGDLVGPYLFERMTGRKPVYRVPDSNDLETVFISAGSLMGYVAANSIVWGTGIIRSGESFYRPLEVTAVRGPLTRRRFLDLGYECPETYGDPALLLPRFVTPDVPVEYELGVVPHYVDLDTYRESLGDRDDVLIVDVLRPVEDVVRDILRCEELVSSSLHGVIASHAYGRPCGVVATVGKLEGDGVKYRDYLASVGLTEGRVHPLGAPTLELLARVPRDLPPEDHPTLRGDALFEACPWN